jgi:ADP-heptose:LPS heptosyltransferase
VIPLQNEQYAATMYHDLVRGFGITSPCPPVKLALAKSDLNWANNEQQRLQVKDSGYILLHGGASQLSVKQGMVKIYPPESWVKVLQEVRAKLPNLPIVVVRGPEDGAFVQSLIAQLPDLRVVAPPDIGKLAAMIAAANVFLCTDSAPMHLGVAVGVNLVALFGPTDPAKLLPNEPNRIKFIKPPAGQSIAAISPEAVLAKLWER